jgi:hypothetical protein
MKKSILFPMLALGMGLFSCSQEDLNGGAQQAGQPVTVTVKLPDDAIDKVASRYIPEASDEQHQLRCILLVTNSDNSTIRIEKVAKEANGDTFSYTFTPKDAADYKCAFWADFIAADAEATGEGNDKTYPDLYYNTQSLPSVSYATAALTDGSLFNNDDCDAYCGTIPKGGALSVELKRPFAKVSFVDKGNTASTTTEKISVNGYGVYGGFNIETNKVVEGESVISATDIDPVKTDNVFFYNYLFVGDKNALPDADKEFSLAVGSTTKPISTENITLTSNTEVNGNFDWESVSGSDKITVTVDFNDGWIDPNAPKVGDYYYSDGTWSTELKSDAENPVIGVVFAVKGDGSAIDSDNETGHEGDVPTNYTSVNFKDNTIHGWVLGLKEQSGVKFVSTNTIGAIDGVGQGVEDIKGYANKAAWNANTLTDEATYTALDFSSYSPAAPTEGTSGWYLPALGQMNVLRSVYLAENSAVKKALQELNTSNAETADLISEGTGASNFYWTSSANLKNAGNQAYLITFTNVEAYYVGATGENTRRVRPILTF